MRTTSDTSESSSKPASTPTRGTLLAARCKSLYLASVAAVVAANFIAYPLYAYDSSGESTATATEIWLTIDVFMAAGLLIMVVTTFRHKKTNDVHIRAVKAAAGSSDEADCCAEPTASQATADNTKFNVVDYCTGVRQWIESNVMFYGAVMLTLAFIPNWFATQWGHNPDGTIWHLIDTVLPVMFAIEARRIWRMTSDRKTPSRMRDPE